MGCTTNDCANRECSQSQQDHRFSAKGVRKRSEDRLEGCGAEHKRSSYPVGLRGGSVKFLSDSLVECM